jgi:molybdenum cofactor biosynthesis enzyme MoaA
MQESSIEIQGKKIYFRKKSCFCNGGDSIDDSKSISISVYLTNNCNGSCAFCSNVNSEKFEFDLEKFYSFISDVFNKVNVKKITFTGGETSLEMEKLNYCLKYINLFKKDYTKVVICTNGTFLQKYDSKKWNYLDIIDNISVSRHHWDSDINNNIININLENNIFERFAHIKKVNLSCNLIKGYVDSEESMYNILEYASINKIEEVAFVILMNANQYCIDNKIEIKDFDPIKTLFYRKWDYCVPNVCECRNYVYRSFNNELIKFYIRYNLNSEFDKGSFIVYKNNEIKRWY